MTQSMTRFDIFIRNMILDALSVTHLELTPKQAALLRIMIQETYQNEHYLLLSIEDKVKQITQSYRDRFYSLSNTLISS